MLSVDNIKKDLRKDSSLFYTILLQGFQLSGSVKLDCEHRCNQCFEQIFVQIFLQNCILLETTTSIISSGKDVPKTTKTKGEGEGWWLDKRVRCRVGCIVSCRRCSAAASAALQIALSVLAEFLPLPHPRSLRKNKLTSTRFVFSSSSFSSRSPVALSFSLSSPSSHRAARGAAGVQ